MTLPLNYAVEHGYTICHICIKLYVHGQLARAMCKTGGTKETSRIKAYINLDMMSREGLLPVLYPKFSIPAATEENTAKGNQLHLAYTKDYSPTSEELLRSIDRHRLNIEPKPVVIEHGSRGSDYLPFSLRKVPVLWFFTGLHPDYHTPGDEVDRVDFDKLVEITKAVYLSLHTEWAP